MESKRKDTLTLLLIIVIVIILGIVGYLGFEVISGNVKETQSNEITDEFEKQIPTLTEEEIQEIRARAAAEVEEQIANGEISIGDNQGGTSSSGNSGSSGGSSSNNGSSGGSYSSGGSAGIYISGQWVLGKIVIPATNVRCSIFDNPSPQALEKGVGIVYSTNGLNKPGNTVIAGHNYKNRLFFSKNKNLVVGNIIKITDASGLEITYEIYNKYITSQDDASFFQRDTGGAREISLSTCTDNGLKTGERIIIWAREK